MIVVKAKRVTLINFFMIRSPFIQFYQGSSTREKQRVYVILAKVEIVYYNGNQVSGKYLFFGKTILEIEWYWINISRESKGMMWGSILVFLKAIKIWH